jgi:hypothetical protein
VKKAKTLTAWYERSGAFKWARRHRFTEREYDPYMKLIGQVLLAWNDLHERLATLFVMAMGGGYVNRPLAIWHSVRNDVGKRHLLRTAIENLTPKEKAERPKLVDEITWILEKADKLEGLRDDSAHTPLSRLSSVRLVAIPIDWDIGYPLRDVMPDTGFQNPRAMRLDEKSKDLLVEFRYARERIVVLRDYVIAIDSAWGNAHLPWPDRPALPERKPRKKRRSRERSKRSPD